MLTVAKEMLEVPWIYRNPQLQERGGGWQKGKKQAYSDFNKKSS